MSQQPARPPEPWGAFLTSVDEQLPEAVELHCLGGFVMTQFYGLSRSTSDIDFMEITPKGEFELIIKVAGFGTPLARRYKVYLQHTAVQTVPENYLNRLQEIFPDCFRKLRLFALDPYDLALSKLQRNNQRDRDDVKHLARAVPLDPSILEKRYVEEMRPYLARPEREDLTLRLWLEMIKEST